MKEYNLNEQRKFDCKNKENKNTIRKHIKWNAEIENFFKNALHERNKKRNDLSEDSHQSKENKNISLDKSKNRSRSRNRSRTLYKK